MPLGDGTGPLGQGPFTGRCVMGMGMGMRRYQNASPYCRRFPSLPRFWWADEGYSQNQPTPEEERQMLEAEKKSMQEEMEILEQRLRSLSKKK